MSLRCVRGCFHLTQLLSIRDQNSSCLAVPRSSIDWRTHAQVDGEHSSSRLSNHSPMNSMIVMSSDPLVDLQAWMV